MNRPTYPNWLGQWVEPTDINNVKQYSPRQDSNLDSSHWAHSPVTILADITQHHILHAFHSTFMLKEKRILKPCHDCKPNVKHPPKILHSAILFRYKECGHIIYQINVSYCSDTKNVATLSIRLMYHTVQIQRMWPHYLSD